MMAFFLPFIIGLPRKSRIIPYAPFEIVSDKICEIFNVAGLILCGFIGNMLVIS
jgi:hypothetical protein